MRTTVTLDADVVALVRAAMQERGTTFKQAVNDAIRDGLSPRRLGRSRTKTFPMGTPRLPVDKALQLAGELEDEELLRKQELRR